MDTLVLCTRNRPDEVTRCLEYVRNCTPLPSEVIIVDSSDDSTVEVWAREVSKRYPVPLRYVRHAPGLTLQRNRGVRESRGDVIHFIDDDTRVEPRYFGALMDCFADDEVVGACGQITTLGPRRHPPLAYRLFLLDGAEGSVLASGRNILNFTATNRCGTEWLSGCSMSFRRSVFDSIWFDETLAGYALGEDVDFSTRAGRLGKLVHEPKARIAHDESPLERWGRKRAVKVELRNRRARVEAGLCGESVRAFWWSVIGQILVRTVGGLSKGSRYRLLEAWFTIEGAWSLIRSRRRDS